MELLWQAFLILPMSVRVAVVVLIVTLFVYLSRMLVYIRNDSMGVVEKLWSLRGSMAEGFIALDGSAGFQAEVLRGGFHFFPPFQYRIHVKALPSVPPGTIGYVFARSGQPLFPGQALAALPEGAGFEDARGFIMNGGQRGPQRQILREGLYAINTAQFVILTSEGNHAVRMAGDESALHEMRQRIEERHGFLPVVIRDQEDKIGVATVHDGPSLDHDEIIARYEPRYAQPEEMMKDLAKQPEPRRAFQAMFGQAMERWIGGRHDADYAESWSVFHRRCYEALDGLIAALGASKTALVFTSGGVISAICRELLKLPDLEAYRMNLTMANCGVTKVIYSERAKYLSSFNEHGHFEGAHHKLITYR